MQFENTFSVEAPIERVWDYLLDVQAVAPCVPGAELTEVVSDTEFKGTVKVKLGAVQVSYKGTLVLKEVDESERRVVLVASGNETRGAGSASGTVTSYLVADSPGRTTVRIVSDVNITGRVAQFGRNIMQDVSNRLIREFAKCVESSVMARETMRSDVSGRVDAGSASEVESSHAGPSESAHPVERVITPASPTEAPASESPVQPRSSSATSAPTMTTTSVPRPQPVEAEPLRLMPLLLDIARSRAAAALRGLARLLEPKDR
jgi:carbon monoxide dehydrogenase subunit G